MGVLIIRILVFRVPFWGVLTIRILAFRVLYSGPLFSETPIVWAQDRGAWRARNETLGYTVYSRVLLFKGLGFRV